MRKEENKHREIKINYDIGAASRHLLDLKKNNLLKKSPPLISSLGYPTSLKLRGTGKRGERLNELFIFGFFKAIFSWPLPTTEFFKVSVKKIISFAEGYFRLLFRRQRLEEKNINFDFCPPPHWSRALGAFAAVALIIILPIKVFSSYEELLAQKDIVLAQGTNGYEKLKKSDYSGASLSFSSAKETIDGLGIFFKNLVSLIPGIGDKLNFGNGLLVFGKNFSDAAGILQDALNYFDKDIFLTEKIKYLNEKVGEAVPRLLVADKILGALDKNFPILPLDIGPIKDALHESVKALLVFQDFSDTLLDILGDKQFKRYLFVFQNNNEIRPTGGFIGSFAVIDVDKGGIKQMDIPGGGSYDIKGQLKELVISPEPFHLINSAWQFQDSNWFPDFPEAAKKMMWFYEKSGGPSVDGVVAINASLMEELLKIIGPIPMPEYGRVMTADNFIEETQKIVELEYDRTINKPKQVIADMAPKVLERLSKISAKDIAAFSQILHKAILNKDILMYAKNDEIEQGLDSFGLSGKLKDISELDDYLMLVDTNIAGQKTDGKIIKEIIHNSEMASDGSVINTVKIIRRHTGVKGTLFSGVRNVNYLRLYVPQGAELLAAEGFTAPPGELFKKVGEGYAPDKDLERVEGSVYVEPRSGTRVNNEFGRTVFGNWIMVDPGREAVVIFKYKLPEKIIKNNNDSGFLSNILGLKNNFGSYTMLVEKQPGAQNTIFKSYVKLNGAKTVARVGGGAALQNDGWQYEANLDGDKYWGVVMEN